MFGRWLVSMLIILLYTSLTAQNYELLGPPGGSVLEIKVHENYPENVYCTVREGGFFRSRDGGETTEYIESGFADFNLLEITYDPDNPNVMYFGIELDYYKTTDGGKTWTELFKHTRIPDANFSHEIEINPLDGNKIYLTNGAREILKSDDGGATWKLLKEFETDVTEIGLSAADTSIIYAATNSYFYKSTNSGNDWEMTYDFGATSLIFFKIEINPNEPNSIYAWQSGRLIKSNNGGESFQIIKNYAYYFAIDPNDTASVYTTSPDGLQKTTDGGTTWETLYNGYPVFEYMNVNPQNTSEIYCGTLYYGVYKSTDAGQSWFKSNLSYGQIFNICIPNETDTYLVGTGGTKIQKTNDGGSTWFRSEISPDDLIQGLSYNFFELDPFNENNGLLCGVNHLYKTTDMGTTWIDTGILTGAVEARYHQYNQGTVFIRVRDDYLTEPGTYRTTDDGITWDKLSENSFVSRIRFNNTDKNLIYFFEYDDTILKSTDLGNTWTVIASGLSPNEPFDHLTELNCRPDTPEKIYVSQRGIGTIVGLLAKSEDGGGTWERIDKNLVARQNYLRFSSFWLDPNNDKRMIVGLSSAGQPKTDDFSPGGLYLTEDDGKAWTELYNGEVNLVKVDNSEPRNVLFGTKFGLMSLPDTTKVTGIERQSETVRNYYLSQNYPNPFNPATQMIYQMPNDGFVNLKVYNSIGQEVVELVNQYQRSGKYSVEFNGKNLSSGVYLYKFQSGNFSAVRKMLLIK